MKSALLVIDVQKIYTDSESELFCENADETVSKINSLIENSKDSEVIYVKHVHKKDGTDLGRMYDYYEEEAEEFDFIEDTADVEFDNNLKMLNNSKQITKTRYSSFQGTDLDSYLKGKKIDKVIVCGFMTKFCCESTEREAHDKDYYVDFIIDATGTPGTENYDQVKIREMVGELLDEGFARVMPIEDYLS